MIKLGSDTEDGIADGPNTTTVKNAKFGLTCSPGATAKKPAGEKGGKKLLIRDFIVKGGKVNLTMTGLAGNTVTASLPDIHLKDIGKSQGGASPAEAFKVIFAALHQQITSPAVADALKKSLKDMGFSAEALVGRPPPVMSSCIQLTQSDLILRLKGKNVRSSER